MNQLVQETKAGLYCEPGEFYIDPLGPVAQALITHAHADHARPGSKRYLCAQPCVPLLERRFGPDSAAEIEGIAYGEQRRFGDVLVSFHPAGHILGSAQIRLEYHNEIWVLSGDYKRQADPTCQPFEVVPCDVLITEATFALPIYRWEETSEVADQIFRWWSLNSDQGKASILFCYALGKAQRILAELTRFTDRTVFTHGGVAVVAETYREAGITMLPTRKIPEKAKGRFFEGELILAPPSAFRTRWMKRFKEYQTAFASGWMRVRGTRRRLGFDRGFVLSDHADWSALLQTIEATGAGSVLVTHGYVNPFVRFLSENGYETAPLATPFEGELEAV